MKLRCRSHKRHAWSLSLISIFESKIYIIHKLADIAFLYKQVIKHFLSRIPSDLVIRDLWQRCLLKKTMGVWNIFNTSSRAYLMCVCFRVCICVCVRVCWEGQLHSCFSERNHLLIVRSFNTPCCGESVLRVGQQPVKRFKECRVTFRTRVLTRQIGF